jgi:hypothetical protein
MNERYLPSIVRIRGAASRLAGCAICATAISLAGCSDEETEEVITTANPVRADDLDDTAPPESSYDESLTFQSRFGTENHSAKRFRFDVAAYADDAEKEQAARLVPSHAAWLKEHGASNPYTVTAMPSVQTVGTYVKQMDDTIYAGVEHAVQAGLEGTVTPKREILVEALDHLLANRSAAADEASCWVAAALRLGGAQASLPSDLEGRAQEHIDAFLADTAESKPIGFYTWSEELQLIWKQDRFLQALLPTPAGACALAEAIAADDARKDRYVQLVGLVSRLTNPLESSLVDRLPVASDASCESSGRAAFLSASETPEVTLFERLFPDGLPPGVNLMDALVDAIRDGTIDLTPSPDDGWYAHQLFALETLLVTDRSEERAKVAFMARYKQRLREAFETMLVQHRETHVKQANRADLSSGPAVPPTPHFRVEPLATVYVRHARSYVFLEAALDAVMGESFLDEAVAVSEAGPGTKTLREVIGDARDRFFGLYLVSCQDLGLKPALSQPGDPDPASWAVLATDTDQWLLQLSSDAFAAKDVRVMIPIAQVEPDRWRYWAVIGVRSTLAGYSYIEGDDVSPPTPEEQARVWLPTEQFLEVERTGTPLTREEFRSLCDQNGTAESIKTALESE